MSRPWSRLAVPVLGLSRVTKRIIALLVDMSLCVLTVWLAYYLRLGMFVPLSGSALVAAAVSVGLALPIFIVSGLYRAIFRYTGWPAQLLTVARAVGAYGLLYAAIFTAIRRAEKSPAPSASSSPSFFCLFVGASRALARDMAGRSVPKHPQARRTPQGADLWRGTHRPTTRRRDGQQPRNAGGRISG
jgi:FlaA1/EpsC-like NDP-sugar epimerase